MRKTKSSRLICLFSLALAFMLIMSSFVGLSTVAYAKEETTTITIFSWEDYIDEGYGEDELDEVSEGLRAKISDEDLTLSLVELFEQNYPDIKVNYHSFATNEEMYNELKKDPKAVNLICPSEYMILKMKEEGLIKAYDTPKNYVDYGSPYIKDVFDGLGLNDEQTGKTYAIGYMWGTMGLIYNADEGMFTDQDFESWTNLYDDKFSGKLTIKDSLRDSYIMALAIVYKDELLALDNTSNDYNSKLSEIFNRTDEETVKKVEKALIDLKGNLYGFEVDAGKNDLLTGKIDVNFAWSGDAVYSMYEGDDAGKKLGYVVPKEGSNVWFDGWVMTKDTVDKQEEASIKFLDFISSPESAIRNIEYVGYTSCIGGDTVFEFADYNFGADLENTDVADIVEVDLSYFFGEGDYTIKASTADDGAYRHLYAQYADKETINRCAVMNNFSDEELERVNDMWNNVKLITFPLYLIIVLCVVIVLLIVAFVLFKYKDKLFKNISKKERVNKNREKYKVVDVKEV